MLVVVAYDVADDRRRIRLHNFLLSWGNPVQESVFECLVDHQQLASIQRGVGAIIRERSDRINYYVLCRDCIRRSQDGQGLREIDATDVWVI